MKRKVMLLMMIIPLILILTIMTVGKTVGVFTDIPVSGIHITTQNENGIISVDMAHYSDIFITAEVLPINAKNRTYGIDVSPVGGAQMADISVEQDGKLDIKGTGKAKITVTSNQNAFSDSIVVSVTSSKVVDFSVALQSVVHSEITMSEATNQEYDYECDVDSGTYFLSSSFNPSNLTESLVEWISSAPEVASVDSMTGRVRAMLSGDTIITAVCANAVVGRLEKRIKMSVNMANSLSGITVNGNENSAMTCRRDITTKTLYVETATNGVLSLEGDTAKLLNYSIEKRAGSDTQYEVKFDFNSGVTNEDMNFVFKLNDGIGNRLLLTFSEYSFNVYTGYHTDTSNDMYHKKGISAGYYADGEPYDEDITYTWQLNSSNCMSVLGNDRSATLSATAVGNVNLTVTAFSGGVQLGAAVKKSITIVNQVYEIAFAENAKTYGIGDELAIGGYKLNGNSYIRDYVDLDLMYRTADGWKHYDGNSDILVVSNNGDAAKVYRTVDKIKTDVIGDGTTAFVTSWKYSEYFGDRVSDTLTFNAVGSGVNVGNYTQLVKATEDGKSVVLTSDIMLGKQNASVAELESMVKTMPTGYDWQFYANQGLSRPTVKYIIEFKNDVYGNGFEINADYIAKTEDSVGTPLVFKGPLDFVSIATASVKAQDNASFLIRTDGVTLNNVILKGCSDENVIDSESGSFNLSELNYVGTVLEVCSDAEILNCRVSNGRTVMRIMGRIIESNPVVSSPAEVSAAEERVNVTVESCILFNAREFILKIGSNRAVAASGNSTENFSLAKFNNANGAPYNVFSHTLEDYFYSNYVLTDVTAKNSVFANSGLFSIGMETHFAGGMLSGIGSSPSGWENLAATSFPSVLRLEGKIKLLDWKKLSNVDSSSLIETTGNLSENSQFLKLDISAMLKKVSSITAYLGIISQYQNDEYVHGGIAMYGGGLNYSFVDFKDMESEHFYDYRINLSVLAQGENTSSGLYMQGTILPSAAGPSDFRFYMYGSNSDSCYESQIISINSGEAYRVSPAKR